MSSREFYNTKGQSIGEVINDKIFLSVRQSSKHLFRSGRRTVERAIAEKVAQWGLDKKALEELEDTGVERIVIFDSESLTYYSVDIGAFDVYGNARNYGHGEQVFLNLTMFKESGSIDEAM